MAANTQTRITAEEYLKLDRASEFRNELHDGVMYAMSGGIQPARHADHQLRLREIRTALKGRACTVMTDVRVRLSGRSYVYPDITVSCNEPKYADDQKDTLLNPLFVVEILSPSTEAYDRGLKSAQYRAVESLSEYSLVSQTEARVEIFRRQTDGGWLLHDAIGLESSCRFESLNCSIPLADLYERVAFDAAPS
jgi:Uma2 family endonuclease